MNIHIFIFWTSQHFARHHISIVPNCCMPNKCSACDEKTFGCVVVNCILFVRLCYWYIHVVVGPNPYSQGRLLAAWLVPIKFNSLGICGVFTGVRSTNVLRLFNHLTIVAGIQSVVNVSVFPYPSFKCTLSILLYLEMFIPWSSLVSPSDTVH